MRRLIPSATMRLLPALLTLPTLLVLAACGSDTGTTPAPDQSQVMFVHAAYPQATTPVQFAADNASVGPVAYGQGSSYVLLNAGSHVLTASGSGGTGTITTSLLKDKSYTLFAYPSAAGMLSVSLEPDDLTPSTTKTRIRLVNFTSVAGAASVKLAQATNVGSATTYQDVTPLVASNASSGFVDLTSGVATLVLLDASNNVLAPVNGTGTTKYQVGQIYTAVASGLSPTTNPDYKLKVSLVANK